jgi:hypothetical protein
MIYRFDQFEADDREFRRRCRNADARGAEGAAAARLQLDLHELRLFSFTCGMATQPWSDKY